jgi:hypothetical protein
MIVRTVLRLSHRPVVPAQLRARPDSSPLIVHCSHLLIHNLPSTVIFISLLLSSRHSPPLPFARPMAGGLPAPSSLACPHPSPSLVASSLRHSPSSVVSSRASLSLLTSRHTPSSPLASPRSRSYCSWTTPLAASSLGRHGTRRPTC